MKFIYLITFLNILVITCKSEKKQVDQKLTELPKEKSYRVDTVFHGPNETETKAMLILNIISSKTIVDSMVLTDCYIHDRKIPFHQIVNENLIFEDCKNYPNTIKILDLDKLEIISEYDGFVEIIKSNSSSKSVDLDNEIMIYFSNERNIQDIYFVNSIDLDDLTTNRLDTIITTGDVIDGYPVIDKMVSANREIIVSYIDSDNKSKKELINY